MRGPNPGIEQPDLRIAWAEPDGLLLARDQLLDRAGHKLAPTKMRIRMRPVAIERDHHFVFGNGVGVSVLSAQHLGFREMRDGAARQRRQGPLRSEEHTSELQSPCNLVCRLLLEKKKTTY